MHYENKHFLGDKEQELPKVSGFTYANHLSMGSRVM